MFEVLTEQEMAVAPRDVLDGAAFVCVALGEAMRTYGGTSSFQHRMHLDEGNQVAMRPDLTWSRGGRVVLVGDAKYKAEGRRVSRKLTSTNFSPTAPCSA